MGDRVIEQWNEAAEAFTKEQEGSLFSAANKAVVEKRFVSLSGEKVLDLGCGYGYYTDYMRRIGGQVIGIDGARMMIDIARKRYPDCSFDVADITKDLPFEENTFDIVFCNQVLMDIENIGSVFSECKRVLKPGGIFYCSIVHPAFYSGDWKTGDAGKTGKLITSYLTPGISENQFWGSTTHYHRPLSFYLNAASDAGLILIHTEEPEVYDGVSKNKDLPLFLFTEYQKP